MVKKRRKNKFRSRNNRLFVFKFRKQQIKLLIDKLLIFNFFKKLHGRFWGLAGVLIMIIGMTICFLIQPEALKLSTAFSDFGNDVRTAPYFAGSVFFASYGLWRWRNYLGRTLKRKQPILTLLALTIFGLMLVALMPVSWKVWPYRIHLFGITLVGISVAATVIFDILLSKTRKNHNAYKTRLVKLIAFFLIVFGGWIALGSIEPMRWYNLALIGETMMLGGYAIWIAIKTYQGEDQRSAISRLIRRFVLIN
jgi:hypothetical protein